MYEEMSLLLIIYVKHSNYIFILLNVHKKVGLHGTMKRFFSPSRSLVSSGSSKVHVIEERVVKVKSNFCHV